MGAGAIYAGRAVHGAYENIRQFGGNRDIDISATQERPPQLETTTRLEDTIAQDWRWLSLRCERKLQTKTTGAAQTTVPQATAGGIDMNQFSCFVPRTVMEAITDKRICHEGDFDIIIERFNACVVFCDASGFTVLTEALDKQRNGAEKLGQCINNFFTPLIEIVNYWGGDIIKFSGDALTIVWPCDDEPEGQDESSAEEYCGAERSDSLVKCTSQDARYSGRWDRPRSHTVETVDDDTGATIEYKVDRQQACALAVQCCLELHRVLGNFATPVPDKFFTLHIGVGFGLVTILQVGGTLGRWEYVVAGPPLQQISIAEPLASSGETVLSPEAVEALGTEEMTYSYISAPDGTQFAKVLELKGNHPPPPPLERIELEPSDVDLVQRFIPPAIFKRLTAGYNVFVNELRKISVIFVGVRGLDVSNDVGSHTAHRLMQLTQKAAYTMEGSVNKFLVDDKGVLILIMFGLPPVYHLDDSVRAVTASMRVVDGLKKLFLNAGIGVASGRVWCGTVGCSLRKEYTAMGDTVNLAARLMGKADDNVIYCDLETKVQSENIIEFKELEPVRMKGKEHLVALFQPTGQMIRKTVVSSYNSEPLLAWNEWKPLSLLKRLLFPKFRYRPPVVGLDRPPLDLPIAIGPAFPWEYVEPWMATLKPTIDLGGILVIRGHEGMGTPELSEILKYKVQSELNRACFSCSNMPDSAHVNIGNVPLLAWRRLCTDMIEKWRSTKARDKKGYSKVDRDNSVYGLAKELIHPIFHWRLHEMKPVISGLVLPSELTKSTVEPEDDPQPSAQQRQSRAGTGALGRASVFVSKLLGSEAVETKSDIAEDKITKRSYGSIPTEAGVNIPDEEQSLAPIITSLVTGFTMYETTVVTLNVRSGTSIYASMDAESWSVARLVGRVAMMRRRRKIELEMKELKRWRRKHSRECLWCRGFPAGQTVPTASGNVQSTCTSRCRPQDSWYFPPFLFVLICSDETDHVMEQQELIQWAKECNSFISIKPFTPQETLSYLAHCLDVSSSVVPPALLEYVHRVSAGVPRFISGTQAQLCAHGAIRIGPNTELITKQSKKFSENLMSGRPGTRDGYTTSESDPNLPTSLSLMSDDGTSDSETESPNAQRLSAALGLIGESFYVYEFDRHKECSLATCKLHSIKEVVEMGRTYMTASVAKRYSNIKAIDSSDEVTDAESEWRKGRSESELSASASSKIQTFSASKSITYENLRSTTDAPSTVHPPAFVRHAFELDLRLQSKKAAIQVDSINDASTTPVMGSRNNFTRQLTPPVPLSTTYSKRSAKPGIFIPPGPNDNKLPSSSSAVLHPDLLMTRVGGVMTATTGKLQTHSDLRDFSVYEAHVVEILKDLKEVPFIPELKAAAMSLMERLEPDEQLTAKCASVFPIPFTCFELLAVYPGILPASKFARIMTNLLKRQILEMCKAPNADELDDLQFPLADDVDLSLEELREGLVPPEQTKDGGDFQPSRLREARQKEKPSSPPMAAETVFTEAVPSAADSSLYVPDAAGDRRTSSASTATDISVTSDEDDDFTGESDLKHSLAVDKEGSPYFYRFKSIAFQHVVADLLLSQERQNITRTARATIRARRIHGFRFLLEMLQANQARAAANAAKARRATASQGGGSRSSSRLSVDVGRLSKSAVFD